MSISFWSLTLMTTRLGRSGDAAAKSDEAQKPSPKTTSQARNIRVLWLRKRILSRRNWVRGAGATKVGPGPPGRQRRKRDIEEAALEHQQKGYRDELPMNNGEPDEVAEIDAKRHFRGRQKRFERPVFATAPRLRFSLNPILRCPGKIGAMIEDGFQHGARIVERKANAQGKQTRQQQHLLNPGAWM